MCVHVYITDVCVCMCVLVCVMDSNREFSNEEIKMAKKCLTKCSILLAIRDMQTKTSWDSISPQSRWLR